MSEETKYYRQWKEHIDELKRIKWHLKPSDAEQVDRALDDLYILASRAAIEYGSQPRAQHIINA